MKIGDAPTDLNARTGLSTPPGSSSTARAKSLDDRVVGTGASSEARALLPARST